MPSPDKAQYRQSNVVLCPNCGATVRYPQDHIRPHKVKDDAEDALSWVRGV